MWEEGACIYDIPKIPNNFPLCGLAEICSGGSNK